MRAPRLLRSIAAALFTATVLSTGTLWAGPPRAPRGGARTKLETAAIQEARARYRKGLELSAQGEYKLALVEFERSNELAPSFAILFNIGQVQFQLGDYAAALVTLERYLKEGGRAVPGQRREAVENQLTTLRRRTARITVTSDVEGADVMLDGTSIGMTPNVVNQVIVAGPHEVSVTKSGFPTARRVITVMGGEVQTVPFDLRSAEPAGAAAAAPSAAAAPAERAARADAPRTAVYGAWSLTGVLAVAAVATGVSALSAASKYDDMKGQPATPAALEDQKSERDTLIGVSAALGGLALAGVGVSIYLTVQARKAPHETAPPVGRLGLRPGGLVFSGTF